MPSLKSLVEGYGGYHTWNFKQTSMAVTRVTIFDSKTRWGICAGLATEWIKEHVNGRSLVTQLGGVAGQSLRLAGIRPVAKLHASASGGNGYQQEVMLTRYLSEHGVITRGRIQKAPAPYEILNDAGHRALKDSCHSVDVPMYDIQEMIVDNMKKHRDCYLRISFGGKAYRFRAGHAVAAWMGGRGEDAAFFDPNYGEFWFEDKEMFFLFFQAFYRKYYRNSLVKYDRYFDIIPCGKRV
ncbi:hypothetical protein R50072_34030 [Simiduia litorea]|uniref:YopT-type cysteine protease domain-containing protein n=1 Tax=Simiduia litorea TaxID=1435348 RepID=UPI0036F2BCDF